MTHRDDDAPSADGVIVPAGPVLDGELVTDETDPDRRRTTPVVVVRQVVQVVRVGATHHHTRTAARHVVYVLLGVQVVAARLWDAATNSRYERMLRGAEASRDHDRLLEWEARGEAARERRHRRRMAWLDAPLRLVKAAAIGVAAVVALLIALGVVMAAADGDPREAALPLRESVQAVRWVVWVVTLAWGPLVLAAPWVAVLALWQTGRTKGGPPAWTMPDRRTGGTDGRAVVPDAGAILGALRHLGLAPLDRAFRDGWATPDYPMQIWTQEPVPDGRGWRAQLRLPQGVTVEMISSRRTRAILAHNLVRTPVEVWPTEPRGMAGVLDLWVADPGSLSGPVPPWPLLADLDAATSDYFAGVPAGISIRGDVVKARMFEANYVLGGIMGSGKSTLAIALLLGVSLDRLVDIDVFVMADNADYEPMRPRLRSLVTGPSPETIEACLDTLTDAYADLSVRGRALRDDHDERAVNRRVAELDPRLRPRVIVIDECQALYMDERRGEQAEDTVVKLISAARKYGITLIHLTPEPTKDSLPRKLVSISSHKACFAIGDQTGNDAVLGTGSYKAGISAVGLEPKSEEGPGDVGTAMTRGFFAKPGLLRSYYLSQADAHRVTQRALALRAGVEPSAVEAPELDPLADVAAVLGGAPRLRTQEVLRRLAGHHGAYIAWTFQDLREAMLAAGAPPRKSDGVMIVDAAAVHRALAERDARDEAVGDDLD